MFKRHEILKMTVDVTDLHQASSKIDDLIDLKQGSYVCVSNVHMCMESFDDDKFREVVNSADLVIPDGRPLFWAQRLLGNKAAKQVRGQDIMSRICELSGEKSINIGLYGGSSDDVLQDVVEKLKDSHQGIEITYQYSPPFRKLDPNEMETVISNINEANVDVLFVGIGCPKQEYWMAENKNEIDSVMLGVGAAFDFISGTKKHAPRWMQYLGLEWFFRLASEPTRLWRRYLIQNPRFIYYFFQQWLFGRKFN